MPEMIANDPPDADLAGSQRRRRERIAALLIVHGVLAPVTILGLGIGEDSLSEFFIFPLISLALSQGSLIGVWIAFGGRATPWRLIAATVGLIGCMWCLEMGLPESLAHYWTYYVLAQTIGTGLPLVALRFSGLGIDWHRAADPDPRKQKLQFSIRALMEWTAALAVLLGTLPMTPSEFREAFNSGAFELYGLFGSCALLALVVLWTMLAVRWPVARILVLGLALTAAVMAGMPVFPATLGYGILFYASTALCLIGSLWVLRRAGYRLVWRRTVRL